MDNKLTQKHAFKGTQVFEIVDDAVNVLIKAPFRKEEKLTVMLSVLNQEPLISKSLVEFTSRVNNEALLSLFMGKPNEQEFNAFVNLLKQRIQDEFNDFAGIKAATASGIESNVFDEPPEFDDPAPVDVATSVKSVNPERLQEAMQLISNQMDTSHIQSFMDSLENLRQNSNDAAALIAVVKEFHSLGPAQGAILTYAPYITTLLADDPFSF